MNSEITTLGVQQNQIILPSEFYEELERELRRCVRDLECLESSEQSEDFDLFFTYKDVYSAQVILSATIFSEYVDESFDHEFGTWDDPNPHYRPNYATIDFVYEVGVSDEVNDYDNCDYDKERISEMVIDM